MQAVRYQIGADAPATHRFQVRVAVSQPDPAGQRFWLPDWIPGSYMIRDFSRNINGLQASCGGQPVPLQQLDKSSWLAGAVTGELLLEYEVYAWDLSVRAAHLDQTHAYFNGPSVFLAVAGQESLPHIVEIQPPAGSGADWTVATSLPRLSAAERGFGTYIASDYDALIDHPVEIGALSWVEFTACGVPHAVALYGRHRADLGRLARDLSKVCEAQIRFFGEQAPFEGYLFLVTAVGQGYGGLEHRASTSLLCSRDDLPQAGESEANPGERYKTFLGLCSHEYFHSWNVKRIKPQAFMPYDLRREVNTGLLWAFEGITSYYDDLLLVRAGLISAPAYLELLGQQITRHLRTPGRQRQSVTGSSFEAWTKYYKQDENSPNAVVSYYVKGALVALCIDLLMREQTEDRYSLDDVMRELWQQFGLAGVGVGDGDIQTIVERLTGQDWSAQWRSWLDGTDELPLAELLTRRGVPCLLRPADSAQDAGGRPANGDNGRGRVSLGVKFEAAEGGVRLQYVFDGGAAQTAGLSAGDVVVAVERLRVNAASFERALMSYPLGSQLQVHAFRRDELMTFEVTLEAAPADTCVLTMPQDAAPRVRVERWLHATIH